MGKKVLEVGGIEGQMSFCGMSLKQLLWMLILLQHNTDDGSNCNQVYLLSFNLSKRHDYEHTKASTTQLRNTYTSGVTKNNGNSIL